jgi:16S rRNA U1498 N3-methylase RsmE
VRAEKTIRKAVDLGVHSIWLTVDAPVVSGGATSTYANNVEFAHLYPT